MTAVALVFHGPTNYPATKNLRNALCGFGSGVPNPTYGGLAFTKIYLLISSEGGSIEDALAIYNLIRALPAHVTTVNMGQIASSANVPFLAGDERWACPDSYFHFHNLAWFLDKPQLMQQIQMIDQNQILAIERKLYMQVFKSRTALTDEDFESMKFIEHPLIKGTDFAQEKGIIHHVGMPALPADCPILNVDY